MIVESTYISQLQIHISQRHILRLTNLRRKFEICILMFVPLKLPYIIYKKVEALMV